MSILLISTCSEKLCEREFVNPIAEIVQSKSKQILHYTECTAKAVSTADKILICGTALQDNLYRNDCKMFTTLLSRFKKPILGICSGMQIVCSIFEDKIVENIEIGMIEVETLKDNKLSDGKFQAYSIHNYSVDDLKFFIVLARSENSIQIIKHKSRQIFGVSFHPEVRNQKIIDNFLQI